MYSSIFEQGNTHTVEVYMDGTPTQVTIQSMGIEGKPVTISWGDESHTVEFEYGENMGGSMAYDECNTVIYEAESDTYEFALPVCVDPNPNNEEIWDYEWHELEITKKEGVEEGSCGYSQEAPGGKDLKTPGGTQGMDADKRTVKMMREAIRKEIKRLHETK